MSQMNCLEVRGCLLWMDRSNKLRDLLIKEAKEIIDWKILKRYISGVEIDGVLYSIQLANNREVGVIGDIGGNIITASILATNITTTVVFMVK